MEIEGPVSFPPDLAPSEIRLRAVSAEHASHWHCMLPVASCWLRLDDETIRIVVGLRLGVYSCDRSFVDAENRSWRMALSDLLVVFDLGRLPRDPLFNDVFYTDRRI